MIRIGARDVSPRDCEQCKRPFVPAKGSAGRFCSRQCSGANRTANLPKVSCDQCGKTIEHRVVRSEGYKNFFCSRQCRGKFSTANRKTLEERFWKHVTKSDEPDGCWLWTAFLDDKGYGRITHRIDGVMVMHIAPRLSWELHNGPIPDGLWVLHDCPTGDNPACCNPDHLFLGDALDNLRDCAAKGRTARGERSGSAKLTDQQVTEMRSRFAAGEQNYSALAREYGISSSQARAIIRRECWTHTEEAQEGVNAPEIGAPDTVTPMLPPPARKAHAVAERFWRKVRKTESCWFWTDSLDANGYGRISVGGRKGRPELAHRISYEINVGPIPGGMGVLHSCDTPSCVRPDHLSLGTQLDNMADCARKGRNTRGEKAATAKVTEEQVVEMRRRFADGERNFNAIGKEYGISGTAANDIINRRRWKHIP